jgi:hypothetical protein
LIVGRMPGMYERMGVREHRISAPVEPREQTAVVKMRLSCCRRHGM